MVDFSFLPTTTELTFFTTNSFVWFKFDCEWGVRKVVQCFCTVYLDEIKVNEFRINTGLLTFYKNIVYIIYQN